MFALNFYDETYASILLLFRALVQLYFNFNNLENEQIRFCEWFFPLVSIELTSLILADFYLNLSIFRNVIVLTFTILFSVYCCYEVSSHLSVHVLKYHLEECQNFMESQSQDVSVKGGAVQINEFELQKILLQLRILVKILLSR